VSDESAQRVIVAHIQERARLLGIIESLIHALEVANQAVSDGTGSDAPSMCHDALAEAKEAVRPRMMG
jgi:hypothetical protein